MQLARPLQRASVVWWSQPGDCRLAALEFMLGSHAMQKLECWGCPPGYSFCMAVACRPALDTQDPQQQRLWVTSNKPSSPDPSRQEFKTCYPQLAHLHLQAC